MIFFWTDQNETPLGAAVIAGDLHTVEKLRGHPDHRQARNDLGFNAIELAYYLDRRDCLALLEPPINRTFKVVPQGSNEVKRLHLKEFEEFFGVRYLHHLKFFSYDDFKKVVRSCPRLVRDGDSGTEMRELYEKHSDKLSRGVVADVTIRWVDDSVGYGLFADRPLKKGDFVGEYCGTMMLKSLLYRQYGTYCMSYPKLSFGISYFTLDAEKGGNEMRFANHNYTPNMQATAALDRGLNHCILIAVRDIEAGEQLTYDYGEDYWKNRHPPLDL
jgi:hypothetical protein